MRVKRPLTPEQKLRKVRLDLRAADATLAERNETMRSLIAMRDQYRETSAKQVQLIRTLERKVVDGEFREKQARDELASVVEQTDANRERDREALLTAENRIVALEDAIVSLAVRVA